MPNNFLVIPKRGRKEKDINGKRQKEKDINGKRQKGKKPKGIWQNQSSVNSESGRNGKGH
jgi:hypothetical protein